MVSCPRSNLRTVWQVTTTKLSDKVLNMPDKYQIRVRQGGSDMCQRYRLRVSKPFWRSPTCDRHILLDEPETPRSKSSYSVESDDFCYGGLVLPTLPTSYSQSCPWHHCVLARLALAPKRRNNNGRVCALDATTGSLDGTPQSVSVGRR